MVLAAAIFVVRYLMDDTIKDSDDIEKYLGLSTLGMIPVVDNKVTQYRKRKKNKKDTKGKR